MFVDGVRQRNGAGRSKRKAYTVLRTEEERKTILHGREIGERKVRASMKGRAATENITRHTRKEASYYRPLKKIGGSAGAPASCWGKPHSERSF